MQRIVFCPGRGGKLSAVWPQLLSKHKFTLLLGCVSASLLDVCFPQDQAVWLEPLSVTLCVQMGTGDGLSSHPERSRNTCSRFMLQELEIRAWLMSHWAHTEALPIYGPYSSEIDSNIHCVDQSTTLILDLYFITVQESKGGWNNCICYWSCIVWYSTGTERGFVIYFKIHIIKIVSIDHWYESTCPVQSLWVDYFNQYYLFKTFFCCHCSLVRGAFITCSW